MNYRPIALLLGLAALGFSLIAIGYPGLVAFGLDRILVTGIGALALVQAIRGVQARRQSKLDEATTPHPELPIATAPPGDEFETVFGEFLDTGRVYLHRTRIREALHSAAVAVLTQYGAYSAGEAEAALDAGTWANDLYAAAFLGGETAPTPPIRTRLRDIVRRESSLQRNVRHTVAAIAVTAGVTPPANNDSGFPPQSPKLGLSTTDRDESPIRVSTVEGADGDKPDDVTGVVVTRESHSTGHWRGVSVVALVGIGVGILVEQPAVLLAGVVGIGFAAFARSAVLRPGDVSIDRTLSATQPAPGEEVGVTVTITNESERFLPDLRLVDGVPEALAVDNGSPRFGTALRPGKSATFSYSVTARRGVHPFEPALLVARDLTNGIEQERLLAAEITLTCLPPLRPLVEPVPLREQATQYVGRVETASGGEGIEFYATREYRPGDAISRIDWNRRARTGEFTTIEFREERAATVVIVIDARKSAYVSPDQQTPHTVDRSVEAAGQLYMTLSESEDRVGIAALNSDSCWLAPGSSDDHRVKARKLLATHPALRPIPKQGQSGMLRWRKQFRKRLSPGTQVIVLTPLCEEVGSRFARRLDEQGYPVTVISPDPTADHTSGHLLSRVARTLRVSALRGAGIPVIDWPSDEPIDVALARYNERWS